MAASEELYDELNHRHFTQGAILNDMDMLLDCAETILGPPGRDQCETFLGLDTGVDAVLQTVSNVHQMGIHSIPTLVVDGGAIVISGAERAEGVAHALRQVCVLVGSSMMVGGRGVCW